MFDPLRYPAGVNWILRVSASATTKASNRAPSPAYEPSNLALLMPSDLLKRWIDLANRYDFSTGWWNDFGSEYGWGFMVPYLEPYVCKLSPEAEAYFSKILEDYALPRPEVRGRRTVSRERRDASASGSEHECVAPVLGESPDVEAL